MGRSALGDLLRQRHWRQAAPLPLAGLSALLLFCNWRVGPMSRDFSVDSYYNLATKLLKEGRRGPGQGLAAEGGRDRPAQPRGQRQPGRDV